MKLFIGFIGRTRAGDVVEYLGESDEITSFPALFSDGIIRTMEGKVFTIAESPNDIIEKIHQERISVDDFIKKLDVGDNKPYFEKARNEVREFKSDHTQKVDIHKSSGCVFMDMDCCPTKDPNVLLEALENIAQNYDHEAAHHDKEMGWLCRRCIAENAINSYKGNGSD